MKSRIIFSMVIALCVSCSSQNIRQTEGLSGNSLVVFDRIDLLELPYDAKDDEYDAFINEKIYRRALFMIAAYGDSQVHDVNAKSEFQNRLNQAKVKVEIISIIDDGDYASVWAKADISFVKDLFNASEK